MLHSGLDGINNKLTAGDPVNKNIFAMSYRERRRHRIDELPRDLHAALDQLEKDKVICDALGPHILENFLTAKRRECLEYALQISQWEVDEFLGKY